MSILKGKINNTETSSCSTEQSLCTRQHYRASSVAMGAKYQNSALTVLGLNPYPAVGSSA